MKTFIEHSEFASEGSRLITKERERQVKIEGYSDAHDASYNHAELVRAAVSYLVYYPNRLTEGPPSQWPWDAKYWKPTPNDRIRELTKAGALIAAEIDRLLVEEKSWM